MHNAVGKLSCKSVQADTNGLTCHYPKLRPALQLHIQWWIKFGSGSLKTLIYLGSVIWGTFLFLMGSSWYHIHTYGQQVGHQGCSKYKILCGVPGTSGLVDLQNFSMVSHNATMFVYEYNKTMVLFTAILCLSFTTSP
jgi:hypothetical protein